MYTHTHTQRNHNPISLKDINEETISKLFTNRICQHIEKIIHSDQMDFIPGGQGYPSNIKNLRGLTQGFFLMLCVQWMSACMCRLEGITVAHNHSTSFQDYANSTWSRKENVYSQVLVLKCFHPEVTHVTPTQLPLVKAHHLAMYNFGIPFHV